LVSPELEDKVKAIIEANTKRWTPEAKKPGLRVKELDESIGSVLLDVINKVKAYAKKLFSDVTSWGHTYDAKLKDLEQQANIKKVTQESYIEMPKLVTITTHLNITEHLAAIKINGIKILSLQSGPNGLVEATLRGFENVIDDFMTSQHLTEASADHGEKAKTKFTKLHEQITEKAKAIRKIMDSDDYYDAIELEDEANQGRGKSLARTYADALTALSDFERELDKLVHGFQTY
jgi:hypothetical protein